MNPSPADSKALGDADPFKQSAFISVMQHGDHLLALGEVEPAWELTPDLETIGPWTAGTDRPLELGAHNRVHPVTGDLFALAYDPVSPTVTIHHIDPAGRLKRSFPVALAALGMIQDFVLTERHLVLLIGPADFDMAAAQYGEPFLQWGPELGTRIGVMDLDDCSVRWIETEAFFVFHYANGFERGSEIVVDYVRHDTLRLGCGGGGSHMSPELHRLVIDPAAGTVSDATLFDGVVEFPRIDERRIARASWHVYVPTLTDSLKIESPASATFKWLAKVDTETGRIARHDFGNHIAGEAVFIPDDGDGDDAGWLATFLYDPEAGTSSLALFDAARVEEAPVAVIRLPQRVPQGLHGVWISG